MSSPRKPTREELKAWKQETARDTLHQAPPLIEDAPEPKEALPAAPPPPVAAKKTPRKTPLSRLTIGETHQLDGNLAKRFLQGKLPLDGVLDLHGMHKIAACDATRQFLLQQAERSARHVLIITGKGEVLRGAMEEWLNLAAVRPHVLAAAYGRKERGGEGALYLLLKRTRVRHVEREPSI